MKSNRKPRSKSPARRLHETCVDRYFRTVRKALAAINAAWFDEPDLPDDVHRRFLPTQLLHSLELTCFISGTVFAAQNAERVHGVPTSLLIPWAIYKREPGWDYRTLRPDVESYFLRLAQRLKNDKSLGPALAVASDPVAFIEELRQSKIWGDGRMEGKEDVLHCMEDYHLDQLNVAPWAPGALPPDKSQMLQFRHSLDRVIELRPTGLVKRNLLPAKTVEHIDFAHFLTYAVLPAQEAQRATGVPASLLIAEAVTRFRDDGCDIGVLPDADFNIGRVGIDAWFLAVANRRAKTVALWPALAAAGDRAAFIEEIRKCKDVWEPTVRGDILQLLTYYGLQDCDVPRR